jgi:hypothetical protein
MYWILGRKSELSIEKKLLIYKTILKPIWTYGIPLWGTLKYYRYQNKVLRAIVNAPRYISNKVWHADLKVLTIRREITKFIVKHRDEITTHPNELASTLLEEEEPRRQIQTNRFNNKIFVNIISQICEHMIGAYSLGYYSARHVLNSVGS